MAKSNQINTDDWFDGKKHFFWHWHRLICENSRSQYFKWQRKIMCLPNVNCNIVKNYCLSSHNFQSKTHWLWKTKEIGNQNFPVQFVTKTAETTSCCFYFVSIVFDVMVWKISRMCAKSHPIFLKRSSKCYVKHPKKQQQRQRQRRRRRRRKI